MHCRRDSVEKTLIRIGRKVNHDLGSGAMEPTTSISSSTSPLALLGSPTGVFSPPSTETAVTLGKGLIPPR